MRTKFDGQNGNLAKHELAFQSCYNKDTLGLSHQHAGKGPIC